MLAKEIEAWWEELEDKRDVCNALRLAIVKFECLPRWWDLVLNVIRPEHIPAAANCPLCKMFYHQAHRCHGCPLEESSPLELVTKAQTEAELREGCHRMVRRLEKELDALGGAACTIKKEARDE